MQITSIIPLTTTSAYKYQGINGPSPNKEIALKVPNHLGYSENHLGSVTNHLGLLTKPPTISVPITTISVGLTNLHPSRI